MVSFEEQRRNMVESQVRPGDVTDRRILRAMLAIPREAFAAADTQATAYMDRDLPVGPASRAPAEPRRALPSAHVLARLIQHMEIGDGDRVMEVGSATGYGAAVLARIAGEVVALESDAGLARQAQSVLASLAVGNVKVIAGPLRDGAPDDAPFHAIMLGGALPEVPAALLDQLQDGGRLTAVISDGRMSRLMQWRRLGGTYDARSIMDAAAPPLPGFERKPRFVL